MIEDLGIAAPADVGYYSGLVDSAFSFAQLLTVSIHIVSHHWSRLLTTLITGVMACFESNRFISGHPFRTA
jgi:hypothetical protein